MRMTILIDGDVLTAAKASGVKGTEPSVKLCRSWRAICCERQRPQASETLCRCCRSASRVSSSQRKFVNVFRDEPS